MNRCKPRCQQLTIGNSDLPGFDILVCTECRRPIKAILRGAQQPRRDRPKRGELARAVRAARRAKRTLA